MGINWRTLLEDFIRMILATWTFLNIYHLYEEYQPHVQVQPFQFMLDEFGAPYRSIQKRGP